MRSNLFPPKQALRFNTNEDVADFTQDLISLIVAHAAIVSVVPWGREDRLLGILDGRLSIARRSVGRFPLAVPRPSEI
jgi:hypothetical protein